MNSLADKLYSSLIVDQRYLLILRGLGNTLIVTLASLIFGSILGILIATVKSRYHFSKQGQILNCLCSILVYILRGTPVLLQLLIARHVFFSHLRGAGIAVAVFTFGLNSSAYISEIIKSGALAIDIGQYEAGLALGFSGSQTLRLVILPQALRNSLPSLINEFSALLKETAILGSIAVIDLTQAANAIISRTFHPTALFVVGIIYLLIVSIVSFGLGRIFKRNI